MFAMLNRPKSLSAVLIVIGALMLLFRLEVYHLDLFLIYGAGAFLISFIETRKAYPLGCSLILIGYEVLNIFDVVGTSSPAHAYISVGFLVVAVLLFLNMFRQYLGSGQEAKYRGMEWGFLFLIFSGIGLMTNLHMEHTMWVLAAGLMITQVIHYFLGNKQMHWIWMGVSFVGVVLIELLTAWVMSYSFGNALLLILPGALLGVGIYTLFRRTK